MFDIKKLMADIQGAAGAGSVVNVTINVASSDVAPAPVAPAMPDTDFAVGDEVLVCHVRKNGERVHTVGTVDTVLGQDDKGWYTRVTGDNGKHYRAGLLFNQERLGTVIYQLD